MIGVNRAEERMTYQGSTSLSHTSVESLMVVVDDGADVTRYFMLAKLYWTGLDH